MLVKLHHFLFQLLNKKTRDLSLYELMMVMTITAYASLTYRLFLFSWTVSSARSRTGALEQLTPLHPLQAAEKSKPFLPPAGASVGAAICLIATTDYLWYLVQMLVRERLALKSHLYQKTKSSGRSVIGLEQTLMQCRLKTFPHSLGSS